MDRAFVDGLEMVDAAEQRGLAGAGWADDADHFAARHRQRYVGQHLQPAERLPDAIQPDDRRGTVA